MFSTLLFPEFFPLLLFIAHRVVEYGGSEVQNTFHEMQ